MPNRIGRQIPLADFNPQGLTPEGLPAVRRPGGEAADAAAAAAESVAATFGRIADEAAAVEGKAAGKAAGLDPNYRPTGATTIRGRAFEEAATQTYADTLEAKTRNAIADVYEANKDDPAALKAKLEQLHATMTAPDGEVFPQLRGAFDKHFAVLAVAYRKQALSNFETKQTQQIAVAGFRNLDEVETSTRKATATLDPGDPATETIVAAGVAKKEVIYRNLAAAGALSPLVAEKQIAADRNAAFGNLLLTRAAKLDNPEAVAAYQKQLADDFAAGRYDKKLDADGFDKVNDELTKLQRAMSAAGKQMSNDLRSRVDSYVKRAGQGLAPDPGEWTAIVASAKTAPDGDYQIALGQGKLDIVRKLDAVPLDQGEAIVAGLRQRARGEPDNRAASDLALFAQSHVEAQRSLMQSDRLGLAASRGVIASVAPLDVSGFAQSNDPAAPAAFAEQLRARAAQARAVKDAFATTPMYFRPEEKALLQGIAAQGGDKALALATAIVQGGGEDAPAMLHEISSDAPKLAQVGAMLLSGGSLAAAHDAMEAASLRQTKGVKMPDLKAETEQSSARATLGQAYLWSPSSSVRVRQVAAEIARTRMLREGVDPADTRAQAIYQRALREASGATFEGDVQYGGAADYKPGSWSTYKVIVPSGVKAAQFRQVIGALTDADLAALPSPPIAPDGKPIPARALQAAIPVATPRGYAFATGSFEAGTPPTYALDKSGQPFILDWKAIEPALRARVPDAFAR